MFLDFICKIEMEVTECIDTLSDDSEVSNQGH